MNHTTMGTSFAHILEEASYPLSEPLADRQEAWVGGLTEIHLGLEGTAD